MSGLTGIELGPDYCVLARAARHGSRTTVSAARTVASDEWPDDPVDRVEMLREIRRSGRFPSRARVVEWRSTDARGANVDRSSLVRALIDAGFEIDGTQTPGQALAQLVRDHHLQIDRKAVAAISLNSHGGVIAVVSDGAVISSRPFAWKLGRPFSGSRPELLERYLVISQLAPELEHIIELVRPVYGADVASAVLCGNLPHLRSLSMLLIEELDLEVETLDASDLLDPSASDTGLFAESAAALQLAAAASIADSASAATGKGAAGEVVASRESSRARAAIGVAAFVLATAWALAQLSGSSRAIPILPDGSIVAPGDTIDGRTIARIERDGVTLRDRSGRETFVPIRAGRRDPPGS